jgi:uncharacterized protein
VTTRAQGEPSPGRRLVDLAADECWELAATRPVGRLAWTSPSGPTVIPVNFTVVSEGVLVRTAGYSQVARECDDSAVAFEVDDIDVDARTGWSVLMRGHARVEYGAGDEDGPDVWVSGPRSLRLRIEVAEITGRRLSPTG